MAFEIRLLTDTKEEADEIIAVVAAAEDEGTLQFGFSTFTPVDIGDACCEAGAD